VVIDLQTHDRRFTPEDDNPDIVAFVGSTLRVRYYGRWGRPVDMREVDGIAATVAARYDIELR
jgi:hypothetical protein